MTCPATSRAARSGAGLPTSRPSPRTSTRSRAAAPRRRGPTGSWWTGCAAQGGQATPYHLESSSFDVRRWDGITVDAIKSTAAGACVHGRAPALHDRLLGRARRSRRRSGRSTIPDSYDSPIRFINEERQAFRTRRRRPRRQAGVVLLPLLVPPVGRRRPAEIAYLTIVRRDGSRSGCGPASAPGPPSTPRGPCATARPLSWRPGTCGTPSETSTARPPARSTAVAAASAADEEPRFGLLGAGTISESRQGSKTLSAE